MSITINVVWIIILITITAVNIIASFAIKFNDLKHIQADIKRIWEEIMKLRDETANQGERISKIEGRLNGRD